MFNAISRSVRIQPLAILSSPLPYHIGRKASAVRFQKTAAGTNTPENLDHKMEQPPQKLNTKSAELMTDSFGEGYATRSDEEGFGGTYGENQSLPGREEDKIVHGNAPEREPYDTTQGTQVKEKEKGRHQPQSAS